MRPRPLILVRRYLPGFRFGGHTRSVSNIVATLGKELDIRIGCLDRDEGDVSPYPDVEHDQWLDVGGAQVRYLRSGPLAPLRVLRILREGPFDTLYLNGFFDPIFSIWPAIAIWAGLAPRRTLVIAPRGELHPEALKLKPLKKKMFLFASRWFGVHSRAIWHATSPDEVACIRTRIGAADEMIHQIPVSAVLAPISCSDLERGPSRPLKLVLLGRLSRMKNLDFALRVLRGTHLKIHFTILGLIIDQGYWSECEKIARSLPPNVVVSYGGAIAAQNVSDVLAAHDVFILPSRGENFGHVIFEALAAGLPVVTSDRTPWRGLAEAKVGFDLSLDNEKIFTDAINCLGNMPDQDFIAMRKRARKYAEDWWRSQSSVEALREILSL